jgi:aspartate racemase
MIGVLGGMGPLATADFFCKVLSATAASQDEDHVPLLIASDPRIPGRPKAILEGGASPLPALRSIRDRLIAAGATALAMPCNTAHFWFDDLSGDCPVPFISIVQASCAELATLASPGTRIGLVATRATLAGRVFDAPLLARGYTPLWPGDTTMEQTILPSIRLVKAGRPREAGELLAPAVSSLLDQGAKAVVLACTEAPIALDAVASPLRTHCVDTTAALARACVSFWRGQSPCPPSAVG